MKFIFTLSTVFLLAWQSAAFAQQDIDLNSLRQAPQKESLPIKIPSLIIEDIDIPQSTLDLKIDYWRNWTSFGINLNQASFSDNWKGGGVNSFSIGGLFNHKSEYNKDDKNFHTELMLQYGTLKNKDQLSRKSSDRIFWDNKGGIKLSKSWSFFASLALETQFSAGYSYETVDGKDTRGPLISNFFAPGYITESVGIEFVPDKTFSLRFGTGTARQTFILDDRLVFDDKKSFGVDTGKNFRNELAFQLVANLNRDLSENFNIKSRYAFFANYNEIGDASHRLDATLTSRVSRVINVSLSGVLWYDKNIAESIQMSQSLALGIMYKFPR
jgi:hypothetical protein